VKRSACERWGLLILLAGISGAGCGGSGNATPDGGAGRGVAGNGGAAGGSQCPSIGTGTSGDPNAASTWSKPFTASKWLGPDMWTGLTFTIAIDAAEHVYLTDSDNIFQADATGVRKVYDKSSLDQDFAATAWGIAELDISPQGRLFALVDLSSSTFTTALFAANGSGHLGLFADFKPFWPFYTVISAVRVADDFLGVGHGSEDRLSDGLEDAFHFAREGCQVLVDALEICLGHIGESIAKATFPNPAAAEYAVRRRKPRRRRLLRC
jgi:hypothetical protein